MSDIKRIVCGGQYCGNRIAAAIRRGELRRPNESPCADCGGGATEYDHRDYNFPLVVEPVCRGCNARRGKAIPRRWAEGELHASMVRVARHYRIVPWARDWCLEQIAGVCARIEQHTGISRHDLRPDLYPREKATA